MNNQRKGGTNKERLTTWNNLKKTSPLVHSDPVTANNNWNNWLNTTLDHVLPLQEISEKHRVKNNPWYSQDLRLLKQKCKRLERAWRTDFSMGKKFNYREAIKIYKTKIKMHKQGIIKTKF